MDQKLSEYEDFREGGTRLQIENGRPTSLAEIAIQVIMYRKDDDCRHHYFPQNITVKEARVQICKDFAEYFGIKDMDPEKYTLYRVDGFNEP